MTRRILTLAGVCALALAACGAPETETAEAPAPAAAEPVEAAETPFIQAHTIQELMMNIMEPQAQVFWGSSGWVIDENGEHDLTPTTDEGWLATQSGAATVTEMGNLLMTPMFAEGRGADWMQFSSALVQIGQQAEQAAIDRDSDAVFDTGATMYRVCQGCHQIYLPQDIPAEMTGIIEEE